MQTLKKKKQHDSALEELVQYHQYRVRMISHLTTEILNLNQQNIEQDTGTSTSQSQDVVHVTETSTTSESKAEKVTIEEILGVIWDQFLKETNPKKQQTLSQTQIAQIHVIIEKTSFTVEASKETMDTDDLEIIPIFPTSEVVLNIENIPHLDVFYSPKHRVVASRQRKRRRTEQR